MASWEDIGTYFGYPECCIGAFCELQHLGRDWSHSILGTGFVPCKSCAETKTSEQLEQEIADRRLCHVPFPKGGTLDVETILAEVERLVHIGGSSLTSRSSDEP